MNHKNALRINQVEEGVVIVSIPTTLDAVNAPNIITPAFKSLMGPVKEAHIDLSTTTFMDSAGVGFLVKLYRKSKRHNIVMKLVGAKGQPLSLIQSLQIDKVITLE